MRATEGSVAIQPFCFLVLKNGEIASVASLPRNDRTGDFLVNDGIEINVKKP
ncbi:protein of unknown function [Candidatus Methylomirabilis oxygeniifera]|uniref:Uncharacterized protein n=1 Tax=Methylomirabilis oxygeniifera TaxID=671143 RepID=D5MKS0_METO1|nr:protein of unknown function [Candidatus Methylomirabilis oxyfera]